LNLCPNLNVAENIFVAREITRGRVHIDHKDQLEKAQKLLDRLQADIDPKAEVANLRIGQQQIVEIAKALAEMDAGRDWIQQFHFGALRNTNSHALQTLGPDSGYDTIGDFDIARPLVGFLDTLDARNTLAKTILYVLNPKDNDLIAAMCGNSALRREFGNRRMTTAT
jgi:glucuronate isomerase